MNDILFQIHLLGKNLAVTPWTLVGYLGSLTFAGRWFVQMIASRSAGRSHLPMAFWYMSLAGSLLLLSYFVLGKSDSVGVLSNLFPAAVAVYNLRLEMRRRAAAGVHP